MPVIHVCHPFSAGPQLNGSRISRICRDLVKQGRIPLAPQLFLPRFIDEQTERDLALRLCLRMIALADEVWVYAKPTEGMQMEIAEAERLGIPVREQP